MSFTESSSVIESSAGANISTSTKSSYSTLQPRQSEDPTSVGEYQELEYPNPIDHGFGMEAVLNDLDCEGDSTYCRLYDAWTSVVEDREAEPFVVLEDVHTRWEWLDTEYPAHLVLKSKGWKAGRDTNDGELVSQYYEYSLQVMRYEEEDGELNSSLRSPVSWQCWIQPQEEELVLPSGDNLICHYGEGTKLRIQTTYAGPSEALSRTVHALSDALEALGHTRPNWETMNRNSWRVWKGEVHHRISEELMSVVAQKLRSARTLVEFGGDGDATGGGTFSGGKHVEERVVSDMWDRIGFLGFAAQDGYNLGLKIYRVHGNPADERLRHPKLEAFFAGTEGNTQLPHADQWMMLRATLRQMASTMAIRSGVALADLREDDYYHPMDREMVEIVVPEGWRKAMREANEIRERRILKTTYEALSLAKWDVLWTIQAKEGCTYDTLVEDTGYSRDYVREVVANLEEQDILRRRTYPRVVVYHNEELRLNAREKLQEVHPDRGMDGIREDAKERRERRERRREESEDSSQDTSESSESSQGESCDGSSDQQTWKLFRDTLLSGHQLGKALDSEYIGPEHVKIRTDRYPELFGPPDS